ncbi:U4/U6-U5 snRNP complex subunit PRP3 NDAI_0H01060 [Naumovozyma dairenensis CBS 421]|uniref:Uncharacterized protein n=1 Tax=Naumovozyma dairenensis (strain ATCC 10597 / BCRC 20456 / CBS 421 / NBRC 0211 / NRRL Y-12639) TaxID=1071378 RepID=G0WER9_NAUDC|nr:hypothetical protein NDAI_0H01060 [Naumovozyma dairenensis CBS 421]CCD26280.1 hypothetical protein NDAI_0H01060 [Naumovozyma dairenensis CBS 421]
MNPDHPQSMSDSEYIIPKGEREKRKTNATEHDAVEEEGDVGRGLHTKIHPALLSSNLNFIREQYHHDNPYLSTFNTQPSTKTRKGQRIQTFFQPGEVSKRIQHERELQRKVLEQERKFNELERQRRTKEDEVTKLKIQNCELPDLALGEDKYIPNVDDIPDCEWWDVVYLDTTDKTKILDKYSMQYPSVEEDEDFVSDEEDEEERHPSIRYIQHPVPIKMELSNQGGRPNKVYLTKKEQKKIRRNKRKLIRQEIDEKIKLGLEPKPVPKVKLSNMMNVYENNQNITDPTSWEVTVKQQMEERKRKHEEINQKRHEEAVKKRREAQTIVQSTNSGVGDTCCKVFWFKNLRNPKIRYKLKMNSKQLLLNGLCIRIGDDGPGIIIVVGKEKSCKFYEKLVLNRIKWDENFENKINGTIVDQTGTYSEKIWEGNLKENKFPKLFMKACADEKEFKRILNQFNAQNFMDLHQIRTE